MLMVLVNQKLSPSGPQWPRQRDPRSHWQKFKGFDRHTMSHTVEDRTHPAPRLLKRCAQLSESSLIKPASLPPPLPAITFLKGGRGVQDEETAVTFARRGLFSP